MVFKETTWNYVISALYIYVILDLRASKTNYKLMVMLMRSKTVGRGNLYCIKVDTIYVLNRYYSKAKH
jgi:hypothetical protein